MQALAKYAVSTRKCLAMPNTSWQLCLLAIFGGAVSASLIVLFIWCLQTVQTLYLTTMDDYTSLDDSSRFFLPFIGIAIILFSSWLTGYQYIRSGIPFILHRLKLSYGIIPLRNTLNQFFGGVIALATGFSVGKEGPAAHLGAACSSYIGKVFNLPYNSIRTLCACGIAAGIAACFNTPVAAVIFVMEVILHEYKVYMFIPIMLAAIVGSAITSAAFGSAHELEFFKLVDVDILHFHWLILLGVVLGTLASFFNRYLVTIVKYCQHWHIFPRLMLAAFITGLVGYYIPNALGTSDSALTFSLFQQASFGVLLLLLLGKILITATAIGLGIPGGIIGPILGIGAIAGVVIATIISGITPNSNLTSDFALMGMAGFMAATLNAPLAALLAVVELSYQLEVIVPAMVVITSACLASGQFFNNRSIFVMQLDMQNLSYRKSPLERTLQRIGVIGVMQCNFSIFDQKNLPTDPDLYHQDNHFMIMRAPKDDGYDYYWYEDIIESTSVKGSENKNVDDVPPERRMRQHKLVPMPSNLTLAEAYNLLKDKRSGAVYVYTEHEDDIVGLVTFEQIRTYLSEGEYQQ